MNILVVANHYAVCSARYAADAFTRLGHTVRHVGPAMGRNIWGMQVPEEYVWTPDIAGEGFPIPNLDEDIAICMDSDSAILERFVRPRSIPAVVWGVDNHVRDYRRPGFWHYFLAHKSVSVMKWNDIAYENRGFAAYPINDPKPDMTWLPCAYDPVAFPPSPIAWADRQFDVCMIGVLYPKRWELVQAMRAAGLKVFAGTGLVYDAYRDAYWNSRVALVSSSNGDLPIRLFEGLGLGCAVLADEIGDLWLLDSAAPIVTYKGIDEAVDLAKAAVALTGDDGVQAGVNWVQNHTWEKRAQVIIDWAEAR